jgi:hypothetical protein
VIRIEIPRSEDPIASSATSRAEAVNLGPFRKETNGWQGNLPQGEGQGNKKCKRSRLLLLSLMATLSPC